MTDAYYVPGPAGQFTATDACGGPWDAGLSHGGPPSALLARAVERTSGAWPFTVVRMAVEILGPVPVGPVSVNATVSRSGRSVELVEATLSAADRPAVVARAWRIRRSSLDSLPTQATAAPGAPAMPTVDAPAPNGWPGGFMHSLQTRFVAGSWTSLGPATAWVRQRIPLVAGEQPSGLQRLMVLADCGNGLSNALPIADWVFINPDLTVHLLREPAGDWLCLDAVTTHDQAGFGLATSRLYDESGQVAVGAQSLFVSPRSSPAM